MIVIGIDPGQTIGLCVYASDSRQVLQAAQAHSVRDAFAVFGDMRSRHSVYCVAIERPRIYSKGGSDIADTLEQFGALWALMGASGFAMPAESGCAAPGAYRVQSPHALLTRWAVERRAVVAQLTAELGGTVKGDAGVWAALVDLHGGKGVADVRATAKREAGPLGLLAGLPHARAALAVAYVAAKLEDKCAR